MKKLLAILLSLAFVFSACAGDPEQPAPGTKTYRFFVPDGAPALAVANFTAPSAQLTDFSLHVVNANSIAAHASTDADLAIMPVNAASKLFGNGEKMKMVAVVTHGNLFIVGNGEASALTDLYGKTLGVIQRGNVPDLTLKAIFEEKGIEYVESQTAVEGKVAIQYYDVATNMLPALKQGVLDFGVLPEPAATNSALPVRFSLQELYGENDYPQAVLMIKTTALDDWSARYVEDILEALAESIAWVNEDVEGRPAAAVAKLAPYLEEGLQSSLDGSKLTHTSIANCNLSVQTTGDGAEDAVQGYLARIKAIEPSAVGDVSDAFFYAL
jgi:NMT1/THI5 domain protein